MGTTANRGLRYPESTVLANTLHTQIKNLADDVDAQLFDTGWIALPLIAPWVNYGGGHRTAAYRRKGGIVYLQGLIMNGPVPGNIAQLPAGFRSSGGAVIFGTHSNTGLARIDSMDTGYLTTQGGGNAWMSLAGISFPADA